jgi:hypothetical protein
MKEWVPGFLSSLACLHANADLGLTFFRDLQLLHLLFFCQNSNANKRLLHFIFSRLYNLCIRTPAS